MFTHVIANDDMFVYSYNCRDTSFTSDWLSINFKAGYNCVIYPSHYLLGVLCIINTKLQISWTHSMITSSQPNTHNNHDRNTDNLELCAFLDTIDYLVLCLKLNHYILFSFHTRFITIKCVQYINIHIKIRPFKLKLWCNFYFFQMFFLALV